MGSLAPLPLLHAADVAAPVDRADVAALAAGLPGKLVRAGRLASQRAGEQDLILVMRDAGGELTYRFPVDLEPTVRQVVRQLGAAR